tara:strand:+ start:2374 stop:3912 length:1539 start_codon:yes stop_codon:yes gene_type:complete
MYLVREVLRLLHSEPMFKYRQIERMTNVSHQSVANIKKRFEGSSLKLKDVEKMNDDELTAALYPKETSRKSSKVLPDLKAILVECLKKHKTRKTIMLMYLEYKAKFGKQGYEKSQFYQLVSDYAKANNVVMRQVYLPGEIMFIDYAGLTVSYKMGKEEVTLYVFVACLGYSRRMFTFATLDMTSVSWCEGIVAAMNYFGGVPEVIQFDNAKAVVTTPGQLAKFNKNVFELANHHNCVCDTSRVSTPTDNGHAETSVKYTSQHIIVPMKRDLNFFSKDEVNAFLAVEVEKLNTKKMQKLNVSRNELFYSDEKQRLRPLPSVPYEPTVYRTEIFTPSNYLVRYKGNEYSVPFDLVHKRIEIKVKGNMLYILHQNQVRTVHQILDGKNNIVRLDEHLKPSHRAELAKSKENYLEWASEIGEATSLVVELQYKNLTNPKSRVGGKYCSRLQKLCKKYGEDVFEQACSYAYTHNMSSASDIELILKAKPFVIEKAAASVSHGNVRGADYFAGGNHEL